MRSYAAVGGSSAASDPVSAGTLSARPAANTADFYLATDVGDNGVLFWSNGTNWIPVPTVLTNKSGTTATPASVILDNGSAAGSTLFTKNGGGLLIPSLPANLLVANRSRLRLTFNIGHTGASPGTTVYWKIGTAGTTADTSLSNISITGSNWQRHHVDFEFLTDGQVITNGNSGSGSVSGTGHTEVPATLSLSSVIFISLGVASVAAGDTCWINDIMLELLA